MSATTLATELNVFADFDPENSGSVPRTFRI